MPTAAHSSNAPTVRRRGRPPGAVKLLTPAEVAERLSVPLKTVYDWSYKLCALDGLPVMKLGRRVRVSEAALADLPRPRRFFFFSGEDSGS